MTDISDLIIPAAGGRCVVGQDHHNRHIIDRVIEGKDFVSLRSWDVLQRERERRESQFPLKKNRKGKAEENTVIQRNRWLVMFVLDPRFMLDLQHYVSL